MAESMYDGIEQQKRMYSMQNDPSSESTIRFLINPKEIIDEKIMILEGYEYDVMKKKYVMTENKKPMLNEKGIRFASNEFNHVLNKFIPQANLSKDEVQNFVMSYSRRIRLGLVTNIEEFGIKSIADLDQIKNMIVETAFFLLTESIDDRGRKFIFSPLKTVEQHTYAESNTQPKKSKFGW